MKVYLKLSFDVLFIQVPFRLTQMDSLRIKIVWTDWATSGVFLRIYNPYYECSVWDLPFFTINGTGSRIRIIIPFWEPKNNHPNSFLIFLQFLLHSLDSYAEHREAFSIFLLRVWHRRWLFRVTSFFYGLHLFQELSYYLNGQIDDLKNFRLQNYSYGCLIDGSNFQFF